MAKSPIFGITGWKNNGKTTLTVRLTEELTRRGYKIATLKHAHHDFDIDHENTDSWRHRKAGAQEVLVASSRRWAIIHEQVPEEEPQLDMLLEKLSPCDLVLIEGFKKDHHDKIEVRRRDGKHGSALCHEDKNIVAIASDQQETETHIPCFSIDNIPQIADFIEQHMKLKRH